MENSNLQINKIIQNSKKMLDKNKNSNNTENDINDESVWKAYSWIEYSILILRLKKYNLLDQPLLKESDNSDKPKKTKVDEKTMFQEIENLFSSLNYNDEEKLLDSLRSIRNLLKIIVKNRQKIKNKKLTKNT
ncbi:MAG TPA: hypothetical protein VFK40_01465 [Nitrososphaeraceae archaeon]|nr:hypothetical protein [Nitrososphaeraceae archaeon]